MAKVLFVTSHLPFPPFSGGRRREYELLNRLKKAHDIDMCVVTQTFDMDNSHVSTMTGFKGIHLFSCDLDTRVNTSDFQRFRYFSRKAKDFVSDRISQGGVDLVHCEGFYMRQLLGQADVPVFLMEQNVEYLAWPDHLGEIRSEEEEVWRSCTNCGAVTEEDAEVMRSIVGLGKVSVCFNGCDHDTGANTAESFNDGIPGTGPIILSVGNFAYGPTYEAGEVMCSSIAPRLLERFTNATVLIVGNESQRLRKFVKHQRCKIIGPVPSLEPYYLAATVVALPLARGRGISVKTVEALARGCAVITTEVGRRGLIDAPVLVADGPNSFVEGICHLIQDEESRQAIIGRAKLFSLTLPTWHMAAQRLGDAWNNTLAFGRRRV